MIGTATWNRADTVWDTAAPPVGFATVEVALTVHSWGLSDVSRPPQ
jgi:hypothetical protein